jgi:hypothetical protein
MLRHNLRVFAYTTSNSSGNWFALTGAVLFTLISLMPGKLERSKTGKPWPNQLLARLAFFTIGLALLVLWYSPPK